MKRTAVLVLMSTALLPGCMPDFAALSAGVGSSAGTSSGGLSTGGGGSSPISGSSNSGASFNGGSPPGGMPSGGTAAGTASGGTAAGTASGGTAAGTASGGTAAGAPSGGTTAGAASGGTTAGTAPTSGAAGGGEQLGGAAGADGIGGAPGGAGGTIGCRPPAAGVTTYTGFDEGLLGPGFVEVAPDATMSTTKGATSSWAWDPNVGSRCPGALHFSFTFKDYAAAASPDEVGHGNYYFASMDWTSWAAVHVMVKVSPLNAPLQEMRFYLISGDTFRYAAVSDASEFKTGEWNEMILAPVAGAAYDPTRVFQIGVEVRLLRAGTSGIPPLAPQVDIWLDDVWLEPQ